MQQQKLQMKKKSTVNTTVESQEDKKTDPAKDSSDKTSISNAGSQPSEASPAATTTSDKSLINPTG